MRTIREMLGSDEKVWVYIDNENVWNQFVNMAVAEGFHFGNMPVEIWAFGYVIAVHSNGNMGLLPIYIWCRPFSTDVGNCLQKIDLRRYINDEEYYCKNSHFTYNMISK